MRSIRRSVLAATCLLAGLAGTLTAVPSAAAPAPAVPVDDVQRSNWGLATEGPSRVVANFDALGWAVEEAGGKVFAGGKFLDVTNGASTERQPFLAAFSVSSGTWLSDITPDLGGPVLSLEPSPDGALFVGGEMDEWNGQTIGAFAKIDPATGDLWPGWDTRIFGGTSVVRDMSMGPDGWLYVAGTFTTASDNQNPTAVTNVIRLDPTTGDIDWTWIPPSFGGTVWGVSASYTQNTVYLAGRFDGTDVIGIDSVNPNQTVWDGFVMNYPCCGVMYDVQATPFGTVMAVGEQHGAYLYDENNAFAQLAGHTTSYDSRYQASNIRRGGDYQDIELHGDTLYASCHCWGSHSSGVPTPTYSSNLANSGGVHTGLVSSTIAYDAQTGARDMAFDPYMAGDVGGWGALVASDGCVWIAGGINAVGPPGNQAPGRDLVRLCEPGGGGPVPPDGPATCLATVSGDTVTVTWDADPTAQDYVIRRSVNGGTMWWRGVTTDTTFIDVGRDGDLAYTVTSRSPEGLQSAPTDCTTEIVVEPPPAAPDAPATCLAVIDGDTVTVTWPAADGAADYIIYRSADGGPQFWRGRTADTTFIDSNRNAELVYHVASRSADLVRSDRTECGVDVEPVDPITPVAQCTVQVVDAPNGVQVSWPAVAEPGAEYVIYRTVDGGNRFWRGRVSGTTFDDLLRDASFEYEVEVKVGNDRSEPTTCTPVVVGS